MAEPAEYRFGFTECADCGSALVDERPEPSLEPAVEPEYEEFVRVLDVPDPALASFIGSLMGSAGIRFRIGGGLVGFNVLAGPPALFVEPSRAEEAREMLGQVEAGAQSDDSSVGPIATGMSLRAVRRLIKQRSEATWAGTYFRSPPHPARVLAYGVVAALAIAIGGASMLRGAKSGGIFILGVFFVLFAIENWRRLKEEREKRLLPGHFRCPDCGAAIALSPEERKKSIFSCSSCGEDFEVGD